ncbi:MAG: PLP-dependent aminotransferase family protein [Streptosporangiales bacterium]
MAAERTVRAARLAELLGPARGRGPAYAQLAQGIEHLVLDGRLPAGTRLPSERDLADALAASRTTVATAYQQLRERGYLATRRGSGSRTTLPASGPQAGRALIASQDAGVLDLAAATPPAIPGLASAAEAALADLPRHTGQHGYEPHGLPQLRAAIAARYTERGLATDPRQIVVTAGALSAWDLALRHFTGPGDRVLCEHPTYPNALRCLELSGTRGVPVPIDRTGWDAEMVEATARQANPRLAYLVPEFHNPTGHLMDAETRSRIAAALAAAGTACVIDESFVELPLDVDERDMPAPFAAYAGSGHAPVLLVGGASKPFWGGLSMGWIRAPARLVDDLVATRVARSLGTPVFEQLVLTHLLADRHDLLAPRRAELRARRDHLVAALHAQLPSWEFTVPRGGLALWCALPEPLATPVTALAAQQRVLVAPGPKFGLGSSFERFLRVPYTLPPDQLDEAVRCLAWAYATASTGDGGRPATEAFVA